MLGSHTLIAPLNGTSPKLPPQDSEIEMSDKNAPVEISPASPPQDLDSEMSIEDTCVSGGDIAASKEGAGGASLDQDLHVVQVEGVQLEAPDMMDVDSPSDEESELASDTEMETGEIITKEIKYEATTKWYERWYKEGKGWEHVYLESWEKAWKYLGVKEDVILGR